ncbi:MAG: bifunctional diaminohydroxyphosphoribosylaminopyrimidine deaminase/5-amino-6-(5-phosphoribosylamino)uracil reductase RibD [Gemmataceae bacterium]
MADTDWPWMRRALALAERGRGYVEPNPLVGAVLVRARQVVGEGWHQRYGEAHAEIHALNAAGALARGATLYVTLEPCCHQGKTPPCVDALRRAGVARVVAAMSDPFPQVAGQGAAQLRAAGILVDVGLGEAEARRLNAPYLKLVTTGRPYVHAKWAMTLDGKIATRMGDSKWISNDAARRRVHELRGRMDAIVAGIGTVLHDDPLLTARPPGPRTPARVIVSRFGWLPEDCQLVRTVAEAPVWIAAPLPEEERAAEMRARNCEVLPLDCQTDVEMIDALLDELGRRRLTNILVEGGSGVFGSFLDARAIDELHVFIAPKLAGGATAVPATGGFGVATIAEALAVRRWQVEDIDGDVYIHGWTRE